VDVGITYNTPPRKVEQAIQILRGILAEPDMAVAFDLEKFPPRVAMSDYLASSLNIKVFYWYTLKDGRDYWGYLAHGEAFNLKLLRAFNDAGIEFAFPTQTLYVIGEKEAGDRSQESGGGGRQTRDA
jgi:MscS family membrane protein